MDERQLLVALNASDVSRAALCRLAQSLDLWAEASDSQARDLGPRIGVPAKQMDRALVVRRHQESMADPEFDRADRVGIQILTLRDADYPPALFDLALPPPVLYCRGSLEEGPALSIVGSRRMDAYGRRATECFASRLAAAGVVIVSGFARGIDAAAHHHALETPQGRTVAVLGCGIDIDYPRRQSGLAQRIAERGALISEFPFGSEPRPWHFPIRNRIIAALSWATLVVQAKIKSGSLITAHHALELGRDVYALPGRIDDELSGGANNLLADGALLARGPEDLLDGASRHGLPFTGQAFHGTSMGSSSGRQGVLFAGEPAPASSPSAPELPAKAADGEDPAPNTIAGKILGVMPAECRQTAEDIAGRVGLPVDQVLGSLLELELMGRIRREPGPVYVR